MHVFDAHPLETAGAVSNQFHPLLQLGPIDKRRAAIVERPNGVRASDEKQPAILPFVNPSGQAILRTQRQACQQTLRL